MLLLPTGIHEGLLRWAKDVSFGIHLHQFGAYFDDGFVNAMKSPGVHGKDKTGVN